MRSNGYQNPFIIMTSYDESMNAVRTMKLGAEDYIPKKLLLDVVYERLEEIIDKQKRLVELNNKIVYRKSEKFRRIYKMAELFAKSDMTVMILGDNGTGKEHIAEKIHLQSKRADKPFEVVDCGTLSAALAVSALFGHEKGAFTSADAARKGYFELAALCQTQPPVPHLMNLLQTEVQDRCRTRRTIQSFEVPSPKQRHLPLEW